MQGILVTANVIWIRDVVFGITNNQLLTLRLFAIYFLQPILVPDVYVGHW